MVFLEAFACPSLTIPNRRNETIARCCARHTPLLPSSIAPNKRMWNVNEHATRQEGDISRNSHGMALTAGEGNAGGHTADPSRGAPPFIAHNSPMSNGHFRDNQFPLMHHQQQRMDPNAPHGSASYLFPSYMGSDPSGYYNYPGMHHSGAANPPHQPPNMEISRLVNMREEHNIMERDVMNQTILKKKISNEAGSSYAAVAAVEVPANFCKQPEDASFQVNKGNGEVPSKSDPQESEHGTSFGTEEDPRATENESEAPAAIAKAVSSPLTSSGKSRKRSPMEQPRRPKIQDTKWLKTLEELKDYKVQYGDTIVPRGFPENPRLASWVSMSLNMLY